MINPSDVERTVFERVEPHIYAFSTSTVPNYLKVGDTYRSVNLRLQEWRSYFPNLKKQLEISSKINEDIFFRDYSVHHYLENDKGLSRLKPCNISEKLYYSNEFFKDATVMDVIEAIEDINKDYSNLGGHKYKFYNTRERLPILDEYPRIETYKLRSIQQDTVNNFVKALKENRNNLLMYAVMRFGKSFTSMCCAVEMQAKLVVIVSAKADVCDEWKKTVQGHVEFKEYVFITSLDLFNDNHKITKLLEQKQKCVVFLTLQDLQGKIMKDKHKEVFGQQINLLLVDETHFGARADEYGKVLRGTKHCFDDDDFERISNADKVTKELNADVTIHLSGTPYRILMGSEFQKEDIIAFYQYSDIIDEQKRWDKENFIKVEQNIEEEWNNPYWGFPEMLRFAFNPNESSRKRLATLKENNVTYAFSALFEPQAIKRERNLLHKKFKYEQEILDLMLVLDGSKDDDELFGFLDNAKIKNSQMCNHIVMVLPYCASCDAMETLIKTHKKQFKNLGEYEILNISGIDKAMKFKTPEVIKSTIKAAEDKGQKTLTLTVNRMLTGSTVPEWGCMLYFKDTASPQEYDQAIFRLQNQYIKVLKSVEGDEIKINMKPQTLLIDFMPERMFRMQELKSQIYNINKNEFGNSALKKRLEKDLLVSPMFVINKEKVVQVKAVDILQAISEYSQTRGIAEEVEDIPVDFSLLNVSEIRSVIENENVFGHKNGLTTNAHKGANEGDDIDFIENPLSLDKGKVDANGHFAESYLNTLDKRNKVIKQFRTFYSRILFFAFLTKNTVSSLNDVIACFDEKDNSRIIKNLGVDKIALKAMKQMNYVALRTFDYKIQNINMLSKDYNADPLKRCEIAIQKFAKLSEAEIVTPKDICLAMVNYNNDNEWQQLITNGSKILDIASKTGEFAVAICTKLKKIGIRKEIFSKSILSIPTSTVAYEFTRRIYEELELDLSCIAKHFTTYDLITVKDNNKKVDYQKISSILRQCKPFDSITLNDTVNEGDKNVKIDAIIGNPPYQITAKGDAKGADPIYHLFMEISKNVGNQTTLIHPGRFLFNAGKTPKDWNKKMLNDEHLQVVRYWANSNEVFPSVDLKGGVAITYWNKSENFGKIGQFVAYPELKSILDKVIDENFRSFKDWVYPRTSYRLTELFYQENLWALDRPSKGHKYDVGSNILTLFPEVFADEAQPDKQAQIYGLIKNKRTYKWFNQKYLSTPDNFDSYKVFIPKANGSGAIGEVLSTPIVGQPVVGLPVVGHTESFLSIGKFKTETEATSCLKYIKGKFGRTMLGTLKVTQDNPRETWANVPKQDFTSASDIDWSVSIPEIDQQLYKKYNLSNNEINFIENVITAME